MTWLAVCSLLLQTSAFAWSPHSLMPHKVAPAQMQMAPCHGDASQEQVSSDCCCHAGQCDCAAACSAVTALPLASLGLETLIRAHFETIRSGEQPLPPSATARFRPPISDPS
jgi:hypothetical protein